MNKLKQFADCNSDELITLSTMVWTNKELGDARIRGWVTNKNIDPAKYDVDEGVLWIEDNAGWTIVDEDTFEEIYMEILEKNATSAEYDREFLRVREYLDRV
jgi:hypothetical protein